RFLSLQDGKIRENIKSEMTGATSNRLYPTDMGMVVTDFLSEHFNQIMNYSFTANVEEKLDEIAAEGKDWKKMISDFYFPFHETIDETLEKAERARGKRVLGQDPATG